MPTNSSPPPDSRVPDSVYLSNPDLATWLQMCEQAVDNRDRDQLHFYVGSALSQGLDRAELLSHLGAMFPNDPLVRPYLQSPPA